MFMSPCVFRRRLRLLCVQSLRGTSVLQPALKPVWGNSSQRELLLPSGTSLS